MPVEFRDIVYEVPGAKRSADPIRILNGISGYVGAGESLAILGPSGSGKTSLLNLLAGRSMYAPTNGRILFGGVERTTRTKRSIGYVMQDDLFFSNLTVRETLEFTADVRLPREVTKEEKKKRIEEVLESLRLTRCENTHIGNQMTFKGISGGERKRLNIANELLPDPALLLGDECTSGLDSASALTVVELLNELSRRGKTVICTIHQPSSRMFHLFDKILLLSSGRTAYFGSPSAAPAYFASIGFPFPRTAYNPSDKMLELIIDDLPVSKDSDVEEALTSSQISKTRILAAWTARGSRFYRGLQPGTNEEISSSDNTSESANTDTNSEDSSPQKGLYRAISKRYWAVTRQNEKDPLPEKYPSTFWAQVLALGRRTLLQKRGQLLERMTLIQLAAVTVMSMLFWFRMKRTEAALDDRLGALFFFNVQWAFFSVYSALYTFPDEREVLNKDRAGGSYRLSAYYLAKTSVEIPADLFYPTFFVVATYFTVNFSPSATAFFLHSLTLLLSVTASLSLGVVISAVLTNVKESQVFASVWILSSMLLSGYYIESENIPAFLRWVRHISYIKFSYESMVRIEAMGQSFECVEPGLPHTRYSQNGKVCPVDEKALLEAANLDDHMSITANLMCLVAWSAVLRIIGYFALKYLNRPLRSKKIRRSRIEAPQVNST